MIKLYLTKEEAQRITFELEQGIDAEKDILKEREETKTDKETHKAAIVEMKRIIEKIEASALLE
jgi:hypothetical protein